MRARQLARMLVLVSLSSQAALRFTADAGSLVNYVADTAATTRLTDRFTQQVTKIWLPESPVYVPGAGTEPEPESQQAGDGLSVHVQRT
jgi:hypothetical protein